MGDYAACIGTTGFDYTLVFPDGSTLPTNGAFEAVSGRRFEDIADGLSNTLLVGDKHVPMSQEGTFPYDCGMYDGHNPMCSTRAAGPDYPLTISLTDPVWVFGSRHPGVCEFVFADGSVQPVTKTISPLVLGLLSQRNDGQVIPSY